MELVVKVIMDMTVIPVKITVWTVEIEAKSVKLGVPARTVQTVAMVAMVHQLLLFRD